MRIVGLLPSAASVVFVCVLCTAPVQAEFMTSLSVETMPESGGLTRYVYTLKNLETSTLPAVQFALSVSPDADLSDITGPNGWLVTYEPGDLTIDFLSLEESTDLAPSSTAMFSFTSPIRPVVSDYLITGLDLTTVTIETNTGQIAGPDVGAVPEPSTLTLLGTGPLGLIVYRWQRGKARRRNISPCSN